VIWLLIGTVYYANVEFDGSYFKGFYYAVNVGYSIGWGVFQAKYQVSELFGVIYLLVGASAMTTWLAHFVREIVQYNRSWRDQILIEAQIERQSQKYGRFSKLYYFLIKNIPKISNVLAWLIFVVFGTFWSMGIIKWTFLDGIYFCIYSMFYRLTLMSCRWH
jgi:hypothetical protein